MFLTVFLDLAIVAQSIETISSDILYEVASVYGFKKGIVSLTFDDGAINQFNDALPILRKYEVPATFYLITGELDSLKKNAIKRNITKEYELGSHTVYHSDLLKIEPDSAHKEMIISSDYLKSNFGSDAGLTFAYPWGNYNKTIKKRAGKVYLAARSTDIGYNSQTNPDRFVLKMQAFTNDVSITRANSWILNASNNRLWLIEMLHGINNDGFSPISIETLKEHLDYIHQLNDKIWCSTVENVIKYIDESKNTTLYCDFCNDSIYKIRIDDFLADSIYSHPISIRIKIPYQWGNISVSNNGYIGIEQKEDFKFLLFNAMPDNNQIIIKPGIISKSNVIANQTIVLISQNPFNEKIRISLELKEPDDLVIRLIDLYGIEKIKKTEHGASGVEFFLMDTSELTPGVYFINIAFKSGYAFTRKMIKA